MASDSSIDSLDDDSSPDVNRPKKPSKPKLSGVGVFDALIMLSVGATMTACIFLAMELNKYDWVLP